MRSGSTGLRSALIGYGAIAFAFLVSFPGAQDWRAFGSISAQHLVLAGLALQIAVIIGHATIRHRIADPDAGAQLSQIIELLGDAGSVLLFALGTFGPILWVQSML